MMMVLLILLLLFIWRYRKSRSYNPYDKAYSHSSYHDAAFCRQEGYAGRVRRLLAESVGEGAVMEGKDVLSGKGQEADREQRTEQRAVPGRRQVFWSRRKPEPDWTGSRPSAAERGADLILIHESGIYAFSTYQMEGIIAGNPAGRYWEQVFYHGWQPASRNYFYNPFLRNKRSLDAVRWALRDMPGVPLFSFAVFGPEGELWTQGELGDGCWAVTLQGLGGVVARIMRRNRRFLKPGQVEEIRARLNGCHFAQKA